MASLDRRTHLAMASVSRRFYGLESTQRTWKIAFMKYFPGQMGLAASSAKDDIRATWYDEAAQGHPAVRFFARLSQKASWRDEYALRTSLLRSLSKGKAESDFHACSAIRGDRTQHFSTLTYWPKLDSPAEKLDAAFSDVRDKAPLAIHGSSSRGESSAAVPLTGRVVKTATHRLSDYRTRYGRHSIPYGMGAGPVLMPNVMDVSQRHGHICFESHPGGVGCYHSPAGKTLWLGYSTQVPPDAPQVSRDNDGVTAVWIAKSACIPGLTKGRVGLLTGSAMGFVSGYAFEPTVEVVPGHPTQKQHETVTWVVSPGVPIVSIKVDEEYSHKRAAASRAWIVVLNALGEVFTLSAIPDHGLLCENTPWEAGRSVSWNLVTPSRRKARLDNLSIEAKKTYKAIAKERAFSPGPSGSSYSFTPDQLMKQSLRIDEFCRLPPIHFRDTCLGWDMRRKLEVDFAGGDGFACQGHIFVITCGYDLVSCPPQIIRFTLCCPSVRSQCAKTDVLDASILSSDDNASLSSAFPDATAATVSGMEWQLDNMSLEAHENELITASALDMSIPALRTVCEDDLDATVATSRLLPGLRGRWLVVGTGSGTVIVWNGRSARPSSNEAIGPIRVIITESPSVTCVAATALQVVHGGSDGCLQAWDPLGSTLNCVRVINAKQNNSTFGTANIHSRQGNGERTVAAIYLDPNPTKLRGLVAYGRVIKCWSYNAANHVSSRKKRPRFVDTRGTYLGRRQSNKVAGFIGAEQAEIEREKLELERDRKYLHDRFMLADLTEEQAILYAQIISEETAQEEELRRATDRETCTSDSTSANETDSDGQSIFVYNQNLMRLSLQEAAVSLNPKPSLSPTRLAQPTEQASDTSDREMELAIRLSLQDINEQVGESSLAQAGASAWNADTKIPFLTKGDEEIPGVPGNVNKEEEEDAELRRALLESLREPRREGNHGKETVVKVVEAGSSLSTPPSALVSSEEENLRMALELSKQEEGRVGNSREVIVDEQQFPDLGGSFSSGTGKGKEKGVVRTPPGSALKGKGKGKGKWVKWSP